MTNLEAAILGYVAKVRELINAERRRSDTLGANIRADGMELIADGIMNVIKSELPKEASADWARTPDGIKGYTPVDVLYAKSLVDVLGEYFEAGHLVDLNADVLINRVGAAVFGAGAWREIRKEARERGRVEGN